MRADLTLAIAKHAGALGDNFVGRLFDGRPSETKMRDPAVRIALEKAGDRRVVPEQAEQLDLRVRQLDEHGRDAVLRLIELIRNFGTELVAIDSDRCLQVGNGDGD